MFSNIVQIAAEKINLQWAEDHIAIPYIFLGAVIVSAAYGSWWVWRFSVVPARFPEEPEELPYYIPGKKAHV